MKHIALVCGGRLWGEQYVDGTERPEWKDERDLVFRTLDVLHHDVKIHAVIHGAARGADSCANEWAEKNAAQPDAVLCWRYPADWSKYGRSAGPRRNAEMLSILKAERHDGADVFVVAFPGGRGTADMIKRAREAKIRIIEVARGNRHDDGDSHM